MLAGLPTPRPRGVAWQSSRPRSARSPSLDLARPAPAAGVITGKRWITQNFLRVIPERGTRLPLLLPSAALPNVQFPHWGRHRHPSPCSNIIQRKMRIIAFYSDRWRRPAQPSSRVLRCQMRSWNSEATFLVAVSAAAAAACIRSDCFLFACLIYGAADLCWRLLRWRFLLPSSRSCGARRRRHARCPPPQ